MNSSIGLKDKSLRLRKLGKSYNEINKILGVPKSTLSTWLKELPLSEKVKNKNIKQAKVIWARNITRYNKRRADEYKKKSVELLSNYSKEVPVINEKSLFWLGLALFWAEGGKREKWSVRFVNSNPVIIRTIMLFFRKICKISDSKITLVMHLYPQIDEDTAKKYWSQITGLQIAQFRKTQNQISKASKYVRPINRLPYGTLHINIGDSILNKKLKGWIFGLSEQLNKKYRAGLAHW